MQAIKESNEHLEKALEAAKEMKEPSKETVAYLESEMARTKAYQAIAYALLAVADALKEGE